MIERFLILDHDTPLPDAPHILFCDGSGGGQFRAERDLDLSHWRPNHTPSEYRGDTSTEICFRFLDNPGRTAWTLAVNNHLDVDGLLAVYTLLHSAHALANRATIIQAAEMGDFWSWGEPDAQRLFQGLTLLMDRRTEDDRAIQSIYEEAFDRIPALVDRTDPDSDAIERSLEPLRQGVHLVEAGEIRRAQLSARFAHYVIPSAVVADDIVRAIYIPKFNERISDKALLWPQVRAKWDDQRVCLVSVETDQGWHHDLWFPGYLWADVENRLLIAGMHYRDGMESYDLQIPALDRAIEQLNTAESGAGQWTLGPGSFMFNALIQSQFPVVARVLNPSAHPTESHLDPDHVAATLLPAFSDM